MELLLSKIKIIFDEVYMEQVPLLENHLLFPGHSGSLEVMKGQMFLDRSFIG